MQEEFAKNTSHFANRLRMSGAARYHNNVKALPQLRMQFGQYSPQATFDTIAHHGDTEMFSDDDPVTITRARIVANAYG
ncbi:MAG: hypothetical protein OXG78_04430 [Chloroflexi bacterium]|nr:hypothetical protein [Chloroflexota bacterium]